MALVVRTSPPPPQPYPLPGPTLCGAGRKERDRGERGREGGEEEGARQSMMARGLARCGSDGVSSLTEAFQHIFEAVRTPAQKRKRKRETRIKSDH